MIKKSGVDPSFSDLLFNHFFERESFFTTGNDSSSCSHSQISLSSSNKPFQTFNNNLICAQSCEKTNENDDDDQQERKNLVTKRKYFSREEDELLTAAAIEYNERSWNLIAKCVPGKSPKQCRDRWANYLQPSLNFTPWTIHEDQMLINLVNAYGTHWTKMKTAFPNKSTNCLKNRWYWLMKNRAKMLQINDTNFFNFNCCMKNTTSNKFEKLNLIDDKKNLFNMNYTNNSQLIFNSNLNISNSNTRNNFNIKNKNKKQKKEEDSLRKNRSKKKSMHKIENNENIDTFNNNDSNIEILFDKLNEDELFEFNSYGFI